MKRKRKIKKSNYYTIPEDRAQKMVKTAMEAGWLLWIKTGSWGNRKKIAKEVLNEKFQDDAKAISAVHKLIDSNEVAAVTKPMSQVQSTARRLCAPWFHEGVYYIFEKDFAEMEEACRLAKEQIEESKTEFALKYPELEKKFASDNPGLYNPENYPPVEVLLDKFRFDYGWQKITVPFGEDGIGVVSKDIVERENQKFVELMKRATEDGIAKARQEMIELLAHLKDKLVDPNSKFKDSTVEKPKVFLQRFKELITAYEDQPSIDIIDDIEQILDGIYAGDLRDDKEYRQEIGKIMSDVVESFESLPVVKLERALDI